MFSTLTFTLRKDERKSELTFQLTEKVIIREVLHKPKKYVYLFGIMIQMIVYVLWYDNYELFFMN